MCIFNVCDMDVFIKRGTDMAGKYSIFRFWHGVTEIFRNEYLKIHSLIFDIFCETHKENKSCVCFQWSSIWTTQSAASLTLWVHLLGDLQSIGVGQVSVSRGDSQDQTAFLSDELHQHVTDLVLNVMGLVANSNLSHTRKVDQGEVQHWNECGVIKGRNYFTAGEMIIIKT